MSSTTAAAAAATTTTTTTGIGFDRESFKRKVKLISIVVESKDVSSGMKALSGYLLNAPKTKSVIDDDDDEEEDKTEGAGGKKRGSGGKKQLLLDERIKGVEELGEEQREWIGKRERKEKEIEIDWRSMSMAEILRRIIPEREVATEDLPSGFEIVGHVAHVNLREEQRRYGRAIGEVIIAKNEPTIRTVVNKVGTIETEFRTFAMEVIAGEPRLDVEVRESGCRFQFNFGEVYWNSRLGTEHVRLVSEFAPSDVVCDMFAGVGPFAIPAAKNRGCIVHANDLNPRSHHFLVRNIQLNRVASRVTAHNLDAREFVRKVVVGGGIAVTRVIMNLPGEAVEFLDVWGDVIRGGLLARPPPLIHCYSFSRKAEDPLGDIMARAKEAVGPGVVVTSRGIHDVRDVAPNKRMFVVTLVLAPEPTDAPAPTPVHAVPLSTAPQPVSDESEPSTKKKKVE